MSIYNFYKYEKDQKDCPPSLKIIEGREIIYSIEAHNINDAFTKLVQGNNKLSGLDLSSTNNFQVCFFINKIIDKDLSYCNLKGNSFFSQDITGFSFKGANMDNTNFHNAYGSNVNLSKIKASNMTFLNTVLISPDFSFSLIKDSNMSSFRWCNQYDQQNLTLEETLKDKQTSFSFNSLIEGTSFYNCNWEDSKIPDFVKKSIHGRIKENSFCKTMNRLSIASLSVLSPIAISSLNDMNNMVTEEFNKISLGLFKDISSLSSSSLFNELFVMGGVFASIHLSCKAIKKVQDYLVKRKSSNISNIENDSFSKVSKINNILFLSQKSKYNTILKLLNKSKIKNDFIEDKWGNTHVIYCNKIDIDHILGKFFNKLGSKEKMKEVVILLPSGHPGSPSSFMVDKNNYRYIGYNDKNSIEHISIFDNQNKYICSLDKNGETFIKEEKLLNIIEKVNLIQNTDNIIPVYNPETHFIDYQKDFIRILDRKTMKIDNPNDWSVYYKKDNVEKYIHMNQGKVIEKDLIKNNLLINI